MEYNTGWVLTVLHFDNVCCLISVTLLIASLEGGKVSGELSMFSTSCVSVFLLLVSNHSFVCGF